MEQFEFHPATSATRAWTPLEPGIDEMLLNADPATGRRTLLQRWQPGAANRQLSAFVHDYVEEIYLADGDLADVRLGRRWERGAYAYRKPGMKHGPFRSEAGCMMFILCIPVDEVGREVKDQ